MISLLTFSDQKRTQLGMLMLDVLVSEEIDLEADVTLYPVEDGTTISDHVTQGAERIRISGLVSTASVAAFSFSAGPGSLKLVDAVEKLKAMHAARALVTISTGQMVYEDFAFTSLRASRSNSDRGGNWLQIDAELLKVRKSHLRTADVPAEAKAQGAARGRAGATNTPAGRSSPSSTPTSAAPTPAQTEQAQTLARKLFGALSGR